MTPAQRKAEALRLLMLAIAFQGANDLTLAGEVLWGAANHLGVAIVDHYGLTRNGRHVSRKQKPKEAMRYLQAISAASPPLTLQLDAIGGLHGHFYDGNLSQTELRTAVAAGIQFIEYLRHRPEVQTIP